MYISGTVRPVQIYQDKNYCSKNIAAALTFFLFLLRNYMVFALVCPIVTYNLSICSVKLVRREVEKRCKQQREKDLSHLAKEVKILRVGVRWNHSSIIASPVWFERGLSTVLQKLFQSPHPINVCKISCTYQCVHYSGERMCCSQQRFNVYWTK